MLMYVINHKLIEHILVPPHYNILSLISFPSVFFLIIFLALWLSCYLWMYYYRHFFRVRKHRRLFHKYILHVSFTSSGDWKSFWNNMVPVGASFWGLEHVKKNRGSMSHITHLIKSSNLWTHLRKVWSYPNVDREEERSLSPFWKLIVNTWVILTQALIQKFFKGGWGWLRRTFWKKNICWYTYQRCTHKN